MLYINLRGNHNRWVIITEGKNLCYISIWKGITTNQQPCYLYLFCVIYPSERESQLQCNSPIIYKPMSYINLRENHNAVYFAKSGVKPVSYINLKGNHNSPAILLNSLKPVLYINLKGNHNGAIPFSKIFLPVLYINLKGNHNTITL